MSIQKKGDHFQVRVRDNAGRFYPQKIFTTKRDAVNYAAELEKIRARGATASATANRQLTFADWWNEWSKTYRMGTSDGWKISQDQMMRDHIMPLLATRRMITIKRDDIAAVLLAAEGKGLGPQMRLHLWNFIHKILDDALEAEKIATNPVKKNLKPKVPKKVRRFLKPADAFDFLEKIKADHVAPAIWIMMLTGLRIGEMQGLTWGDVDFERSEIWVKRQWAKKEKRFKSLKNNKWVRVPLLPELQSYLEAYKASDVRPETPIVQSIKGQDIISYDTVEDGLKRLCRLHNIAPLAPHECRHTCSEIWIERGANITDIMRLLNHSSEASTKPYIHRTEERLSAVAKTGRPLRLVK